jgi:hypothetical protein
LTRIRTYCALCALVLGVPTVIAGCGGDDTSDLDPQTVIDQTFNNDERVSSGDLSLSLGASATGDQGGSLEASMSGPFQGNPDNPSELPQLDWTASITADGAGQSFSFDGGVTVTEDNAFVEYGGQAYEVGADAFGQVRDAAEQAAAEQPDNEGLSFTQAFSQACEQSLRSQGASDTSACDVDFESWLGDLTNDGAEEIEGTETTRISGTVDVETMLGDLVELGTAVPQGAGTVPTDEQVQQAADAVTEASFDLYSGTDDSILRGIDFNLALDPNAIPDADAAGVDSVDLNFSMRLGGVNEEQTIDAPSGAKPIDELLGQFGVAPRTLGGLDALGAGGVPAAPATPAPQSGGGDPNAYLDCIAEASTPEAIEACASDL